MQGSSIVFRFVTRSILKSMYTDMVYRLERLAALTNGSCTKIGDCTEWEYNPHSELRAVCRDVYFSRYQEEPVVIVEHVGLECGAIMKHVDHPVDAISLGPITGNYHTPGEWFSISSTERFRGFLKEVLQTHIPKNGSQHRGAGARNLLPPKAKRPRRQSRCNPGDLGSCGPCGDWKKETIYACGCGSPRLPL